MGHFERGVENYKKGNHLIAINQFTKWLERAPNDVKAYIYRGNAYSSIGNHHAALINFSQAIQIDPRNISAHNNRAVTHEKLNNYEEAIKDYSKTIEIAPQQPNAYNNRGVLQYGQKKYKEAIEDISRAIELNPNYAKAYYNRGNALQKLGKSRQADLDYSKAIELDPKFEYAYIKRGEGDEEEKQYSKAIVNYTKLIELDEKNEDAYFRRAFAHKELKNYKEAEADYLVALNISPQNFLYLLNLSQCYLDMGQKFKAKMFLQQGVSKFRELTQQILVKRFGMAEKQIISLTKIVGEYERRRDQIYQLKQIAKKIKKAGMVNQLEKAEEMNEGSFLNQAAEGYKDPISTTDCSQNSTLNGYNRHTVEQIDQVKRQLVKINETQKLCDQMCLSQDARKAAKPQLESLSSSAQMGRAKNTRTGCCTTGECMIY